MATQKPTFKFGRAPFGSPTTADIVLRTSDNVMLFTYKSDIMRASAIFSNLLSDATPDESFGGHPLIPVSESSHTMHFVLRLCSPLCSPGYITAEDIVRVDHIPVLSALDKYLMDAPRRIFKTLIEEHATDIIDHNPLGAFALARAVGLQDISFRAASHAVYFRGMRHSNDHYR